MCVLTYEKQEYDPLWAKKYLEDLKKFQEESNKINITIGESKWNQKNKI